MSGEAAPADPLSTRLPLDRIDASRSAGGRFREHGELAAAAAWQRSTRPVIAGAASGATEPAPPCERPRKEPSPSRDTGDGSRHEPAEPEAGPPRTPVRSETTGARGTGPPGGRGSGPSGTAIRDAAEGQVRWAKSLKRERAALDSERANVEKLRQELDERAALLVEHERLAHQLETRLRRMHESLVAREEKVGQREAALEAAARPGRDEGNAPSVVPVPLGEGTPAVGRTLSPGTGAAGADAAVPDADKVHGPLFLDHRGHPPSDRMPTGTPRLDDLLLGGLPPRSHVALVGDPFVGKEVVLYGFIAEGLRRHEPAVLVTTTRSFREVSRALQTVLPDFPEHEKDGRVFWIDASDAGPREPTRRSASKGTSDTWALSESLVDALKRGVAVSPTGQVRVGFLGLSALLTDRAQRESFRVLQHVMGILKAHQALTMYSLEAGALTQPQVESLLGRMDGAILFRQERGRTLMSAKGFGGVATRDWIECHATERSLILGSFALERIR